MDKQELIDRCVDGGGQAGGKGGASSGQAGVDPDNSWHERGELPPIDTICQLSEPVDFLSLASGEVTIGKKGDKVAVVGFAKRIDNKAICVTLMLVGNESAGFATGNSSMMIEPINSDRESLIDVIVSAGNVSHGMSALADAIIAAGWSCVSQESSR